MSHILVVDDEPFCRELISFALTQSGYEVACSVDGVEALEQMRRRRPDLVILDAHMPRLDGLGVLRAMRTESQLSHVPVFLLTAVEERNMICRAGELGIQAYLLKSKFILNKVLERVKQQFAAPVAAPVAAAISAGAAPLEPGSKPAIAEVWESV